MSTEKKSTFNPEDNQQNKPVGSQNGVVRPVTKSESQESDTVDTDKKVDKVEGTDENLSVEDIIALEMSRNRGALRRTASQRAKAGIPVTGYQAQAKGTPKLEKSQGLTDAQVNQLAQVGISILFLAIVVAFTWYVLLPEVENSPATPYQGMKQEARVEKYRKMFGLDSSTEGTAQTQSEQDLFDKSMTLGQNESDIFEKNPVLSEPALGEDAGTSSNGLVAIPSEEEFEDMNTSQKRRFVQRVLEQMESQVDDIQKRSLVKYSSGSPEQPQRDIEGAPADTVNASFNSWADEGKGTYKDLLQLLNLKHKRLEESKKIQAKSTETEANRQSANSIVQTESSSSEQVVEDVIQRVDKEHTETDSVVLITMEGEVEKVCADSIRQKSIEAEKVLATAIAREMKIIKVDVPVVSGEIPEKYAKNIMGLLVTHTVQSGETLSSLSRLYYNHIKYASYIYAFNRDVIVNKDVLPVGLKLDIPIIKGVQVVDTKKRNK